MGGAKTAPRPSARRGTRGDGRGSAREVEGEIGVPARRRPDRSGAGGVGRQAEVAQDALHNGRVLDRRDETEPTAAGARENVDLKNPAQQVGPRERATTRRRGRRRRRGVGGTRARARTGPRQRDGARDGGGAIAGARARIPW